MRLVCSNHKQITGLKWLHVVPNDKRPLSRKNPGDLDFNMAMQMRIKKRQLVFLDMNGIANLFRYREINDFHKIICGGFKTFKMKNLS